jgi:hypothetical protein
MSFSCAPVPQVGVTVTCTVVDGPTDFDILWRASYNPVFASGVVTLDGAGAGSFSFVVPREALGLPVGVELVDHTAVMVIGSTTASVPTSVPAGGGPAPLHPVAPLLLLGAVLLFGPAAARRGTMQH